MSACKPVCTYDANGKLIHYKNSSGYESWWEYDSNGNAIHYKNNDGYEWWHEYDSKGQCIHRKYNNGDEEWYWEGKPTTDPINILLLASQLCSNNNTPLSVT